MMSRYLPTLLADMPLACQPPVPLQLHGLTRSHISALLGAGEMLPRMGAFVYLRSGAVLYRGRCMLYDVPRTVRGFCTMYNSRLAGLSHPCCM